MVFIELDQVPEIAVQILEYRDHAVIGLFRFSNELDAFGSVIVIVPPEIIGPQEQEYAPSRLVADERFLFFFGSAHEQERGSLPASGSDDDPAFILFALVRVVEQFEGEFIHVEVDGLVIVAYDERDVGDELVYDEVPIIYSALVTNVPFSFGFLSLGMKPFERYMFFR